MGRLLVGFFLFFFLSYIPVYATTIVGIEEASTFAWREQLSDCEWIDHFETRKTTTYQEITAGFLPMVAPYIEPPKDATKGQWNPCSSEYADASGNLPAYCPRERLPEPALTPMVIGVALTSAQYSDPIVKEWSEIEVGTNALYRNVCDDCPDPIDDPPPIDAPLQTPVPEPASWLLMFTGLVGILLFRRKQ